MKVKTSKLTGAALDWAVAVAEGLRGVVEDGPEMRQYRPSTNWSLAGPIIEREGINTVRCNDLYFPKGNEQGQHWEPEYKAFTQTVVRYGPTPLIAAMRCYVTSKLGDEVGIPKELL